MKTLTTTTQIILALSLSILTLNSFGSKKSDKKSLNEVSTQKINKQKLNKEDYKISYEEFLSQHGTDDTSIAIIDIYFNKRENLSGPLMSFTPVAAGIAVAFPPVGIPLTVISTPLFAGGAIVRGKYSRKNLLKTLNAYHNDDMISEKLNTKVGYYLEGKAEFMLEEAEENQLANLKAIYNSEKKNNDSGVILSSTELTIK